MVVDDGTYTNMLVEREDGFKWNPTESKDKCWVDCKLDPEAYEKLLLIAYKNNILTFDPGVVLKFCLDQFQID